MSKKIESEPQPSPTEQDIKGKLKEILAVGGDSEVIMTNILRFLRQVQPSKEENHMLDEVFEIDEEVKDLSGGRSKVTMGIMYANGKFMLYPKIGASSKEIFNIMQRARETVEAEGE